MWHLPTGLGPLQHSTWAMRQNPLSSPCWAILSADQSFLRRCPSSPAAPQTGAERLEVTRNHMKRHETTKDVNFGRLFWTQTLSRPSLWSFARREGVKCWTHDVILSSCHDDRLLHDPMDTRSDQVDAWHSRVTNLKMWRIGNLAHVPHVPFWLVRRPTKLKMHALSSSCEHKNSKHPTALFQPTLRPNFRCKWRLHSNFPDLPEKALKNRSQGWSRFCMGRGQIFCAELRGNTLVSRWIPAAVDASTVVSRWSDLVKWEISEDSGFYLSQHLAVQNSNKEITLPSNLRMTTCDTLGWHQWHICDDWVPWQNHADENHPGVTGWWQGRWSLHLNCLWRSDLICISRRPGPRFPPLSKLLKSHTTWHSFTQFSAPDTVTIRSQHWIAPWSQVVLWWACVCRGFQLSWSVLTSCVVTRVEPWWGSEFLLCLQRMFVHAKDTGRANRPRLRREDPAAQNCRIALTSDNSTKHDLCNFETSNCCSVAVYLASPGARGSNPGSPGCGSPGTVPDAVLIFDSARASSSRWHTCTARRCSFQRLCDDEPHKIKKRLTFPKQLTWVPGPCTPAAVLRSWTHQQAQVVATKSPEMSGGLALQSFPSVVFSSL